MAINVHTLIGVTLPKRKIKRKVIDYVVNPKSQDELDKECWRFVTVTLRRLSVRWPPRSEALRRSRVAPNSYRCALCKEVFKRDFVDADHIVPVIPLTGRDSFKNAINRMLCDIDGFQTACKECHGKKTGKENAVRRENRKKSK